MFLSSFGPSEPVLSMRTDRPAVPVARGTTRGFAAWNFGGGRAVTKPFHMIIRVLEEEHSVRLYEQAFGFGGSHRLTFDDFTQVYFT